MANHTGGVVGGVDAHADEHHVAVVDLQGRLYVLFFIAHASRRV